jgi:hypothetical protein
VKTEPGFKVSLPRTSSDCAFWEKVDEPTTKRGAEVGLAGVTKVLVSPLITTAFPVGFRLRVDPSKVTIPPGRRVRLPRTRLDCESCANVADPTTTIGVGEGDEVIKPVFDGKGRVMTSLPEVIALPGKSVWLPITNPEAEFGVILVPPTTATAGAIGELGTDCELIAVAGAALMTIAPLEPTLICWPLMVATLPGESVFEPKITFEELSVLAVREPMTIGSGEKLDNIPGFVCDKPPFPGVLACTGLLGSPKGFDSRAGGFESPDGEADMILPGEDDKTMLGTRALSVVVGIVW